MQEIDDITSILNAVNDINSKPKKKASRVEAPQNFIPELNKDLILPLDVDKIIREAEEHKKKAPLKPIQIELIKNKNEPKNIEYHNKVFEEIQTRIIADLYSKLSKKVKKNTLKIIFNLNLKIKDLEKKLESVNVKKELYLNKTKINLKDEAVESLKIPDPSIIDLNKVLSKKKSFLKDEVVSSLEIQDSTIAFLNEKIKGYKNTEEKLRFQIIDLEQDKTLLLKKTEKLEKLEENKNILHDTKDALKYIYQKVLKQKKFFLDLKNYSYKIEKDYSFYKENYEKLIIENSEIKKKLLNTKQQVEAFDEIKKELAITFENFNNVLSKNSIIKLNESFSKINTNLTSDNINKKEE